MKNITRQTKTTVFLFSCLSGVSFAEYSLITNEHRLLILLGHLYTPWAVKLVRDASVATLIVLIVFWVVPVWLYLRKVSSLANFLIVAVALVAVVWNVVLLSQWSSALESIVAGTGLFDEQ